MTNNTEVATLQAKFEADTGNFEKGAKTVQSGLGSIANLAKGVGNLLTGMIPVALFGAAIKEASDMQTELAQLDAVLKSTKGAAGVTEKAVVGLASAFQKTTRFSDDQVLSAENILLTFPKISKNIFPDVTEAVLDMATALKMDTKAAAIMIGKMLQSSAGVNAAARAGVNFTKQEQAKITALYASGRAAEAQVLILKELQTEFGGSARAAGATFAGSLDRLRNSALDLAETIGMAILPALQKFVDFGIELIGGIDQIDPALITLAAGFGLVAVAAGPIGGILTAILSPIGLVVAAVVGIKAAFENNLGGITTFVQGIVTGISGALGDIKNAIEGVFATATGNAPYGAAPSGDEVNQSLKTHVNKPGIKDTQYSVLPTKTRGSDFGSRLTQVIDEALPQVKDAIDRLGLAIKKTLVEKLGISTELQATIERFFSPITEGFKNLATVNWGNVGIAGVAIAAFAIGVKGVGLAFSLFKSMVIFELFTVVLKQISEFVDAVKIGDVGGALKSFAVGVGALGLALAIGKIGTLGSVVGALSAATGISAGLSTLASGLWAIAGPIGAIALASAAFIAVMDALTKSKPIDMSEPNAAVPAAKTSLNKGVAPTAKALESGGVNVGANAGIQAEQNLNIKVGMEETFAQKLATGVPMDQAMAAAVNQGIQAGATLIQVADLINTIKPINATPELLAAVLKQIDLTASAKALLSKQIEVKVTVVGGGIQGRAQGGSVGAGMYRVVENGPEMLTMNGNSYLMSPGNGYVTPMQSGRGGNGGGNTTIVNVNGQFSLEMIDNELRRRNLAPLGGRK
jgi:hypothetical protein